LSIQINVVTLHREKTTSINNLILSIMQLKTTIYRRTGEFIQTDNLDLKTIQDVADIILMQDRGDVVIHQTDDILIIKQKDTILKYEKVGD
jgi:hypothetical protein